MREPRRDLRREPARRITVTLLFLFYGLLLAEGPLRKWVLPGASNALVFLRDPVMLLILLAAAAAGPSRGARRAMTLFAAVLLGCLACVTGQLAGSDVAPLAIGAGLRNYFLFVPLAWIVADSFTAADYGRWLRLNLWLAGPIGLLVVAQYRAPPTSLINAVPGGGNDGVFLLVADVVRPYGLFSFTLGHSVFAAWMAGVLLAGLSARRRFGIGPWLAVAGAVGTLTMAACSGSRTTVLLVTTVLLFYLVAALLSPVAVQRRRALGLGAAVVSAALAVLMLAPGLGADLAERQATAVASEGGTGDRLAQLATEFIGALEAVPPLGLGLGAGTNVANYLANGRTDRLLAEYELTRIVQELGPFFGLGLIAARWVLAAWLALAALGAARRGNGQPACYAGLVLPLLAVHDVTLQNSMIGIAWFSIGIMAAALRLEPARLRTPPALAPARPWEVPACA